MSDFFIDPEWLLREFADEDSYPSICAGGLASRLGMIQPVDGEKDSENLSEEQLAQRDRARALLKTGIQVLVEKLGKVEAEHFVSLLLREPFDYTKWQAENLFVGMTIQEINAEAEKSGL